MRVRALSVLVLLVGLTFAVAPTAATTQNGGKLIESIQMDVTINPASAEWAKEALDDAKSKHAYMVIFRLDTPGGLDDSMRKIIKNIIAAPMPVVVYVYPNGARAASAGLYITQSADVAAMAPQTNIGSATPISLGGGNQDQVLGRKIRNDATAYVRALAEVHGRNANLAAQMVQKATNVPALEAKSRNLVDVIAPDVPTLVRQLDGFHVKGPKAQTLHTAGARIESRSVPFKFRLLELLVNPNTVFLLFTLGLIGIGFELFHPGAILPGTIGAVSLIIALFGLAQLPINIAGLLLILLAFGLFVSEAFLPSHGALAIGGVVSLIFGGLLLFNTNDAYEVSVPIVVFTAALLGSSFAWVIGKAVQARHRAVHTGAEEMIGALGVVRSKLDPVGHVFVKGALWRARTPDGRPLDVGERVIVDDLDGLTLTVSPAVREPEPQRVE